MLFAQTLAGWRHRGCPVTFRAACVAVAGAPIAWPDGLSVDLAKFLFARTRILRLGFHVVRSNLQCGLIWLIICKFLTQNHKGSEISCLRTGAGRRRKHWQFVRFFLRQPAKRPTSIRRSSPITCIDSWPLQRKSFYCKRFHSVLLCAPVDPPVPPQVIGLIRTPAWHQERHAGVWRSSIRVRSKK